MGHRELPSEQFGRLAVRTDSYLSWPFHGSVRITRDVLYCTGVKRILVQLAAQTVQVV